MNVPFSRLMMMRDSERPDRRKLPRQPAWAMAYLRSSQGDECQVNLLDVTTHGCSVRCEGDWLRTGSFVSLEMETGPALQAIVRWVRDSTAGMEFLREVPADHVEWHALMNMSFGP